LGAVFAFVMSCARPEPSRSRTKSRHYINLLNARVQREQPR
jgi:hypothetical protein